MFPLYFTCNPLAPVYLTIPPPAVVPFPSAPFPFPFLPTSFPHFAFCPTPTHTQGPFIVGIGGVPALACLLVHLLLSYTLAPYLMLFYTLTFYLCGGGSPSCRCHTHTPTGLFWRTFSPPPSLFTPATPPSACLTTCAFPLLPTTHLDQFCLPCLVHISRLPTPFLAQPWDLLQGPATLHTLF